MSLEKRDERFRKGKGALEVGRLDEAEEFFKEILEENPDEIEVLNKMGVLYIYRKEPDKAREYFDRCLNLDKTFAPALSNLGNLDLDSGNTNKAEMMYRQALKFDPKYGPAHNNLAFILKKSGRIAEAVKHMRKAQKAGTFSIDSKSKENQKTNKGCLTVIILAAIALILYFLTTIKG